MVQPQNNLSELNNNLKIIVDNFSTCPTTRRKMPLRRHQTFNLATHSHACLLYFLVHPASTYISSTILITTTTIQENHDVLIHFLFVPSSAERQSSNALSTILQTTVKISFMLPKPPPLVQITQLVPTSCCNLKTTSQSSTTT